MTMTVAMTKPVVTHVICSTVTPSEPVRWGTATLTIEASMAPINVPKVIDTVTSHLLTGGRSSAAVALGALDLRVVQRHAGAGDVGVDVAVEERHAQRAGDAPRPVQVIGVVAAHVADEVDGHARRQPCPRRGESERGFLLVRRRL